MSKYIYMHTHACRELVRIAAHYRTRRSQKDIREMYRKLFDFYSTHGLGMLDSFAHVRDVKFIFPSGALHAMKPIMVGRKAALYSGCSLCVLPTTLRLGNQRIDSAEYFFDFVDTNRAVIASGRLIPFPSLNPTASYGHYAYHGYRIVDMLAIQRKVDDSRITGYASRSDSVPLFGKHGALVQQINEDIPEAGLEPIAMRRLLLPTLNGIDSETLVRVLDDQGDPTENFRHAFRRLLKDTDVADSEAKLLQALEEVDYEVRKVDSAMQRIKRDRALRTMEVAVGVTSTGMSILAPEWLSQPIGAVFGATTVVDGIRSISELRKEESHTRDNDFFLPWILHRRSQS